MSVSYTERAYEELAISMEWYEKQQDGLGRYFLDCIEVAVSAAQEGPLSFPLKYRNIRASVVKRFPFTVYFTIEGEDLVVHAVFSDRKDPQYLP